MLKPRPLADAAVPILHSPDPGGNGTFHSGAEKIREQLNLVLDEPWCERCNEQLIATLLIGLVSFVFWFILRRGFNRNVVVLAIPIVGFYMVLNAIIIGSGVGY